jgi:hypothetical protein
LEFLGHPTSNPTSNPTPILPKKLLRLWALLLLWREIVFGVTYELRVKYKIGRRNRYTEGRNNRQMTPRGYRNFYSYVKNLRVLVFRMDRQTDRQTEKYTCCTWPWAGGTFFQLCCCVSFWFWWEIGFGITYLGT